ncbi:MAG TPA: alpha/beta fold hydrolase [Blastocatellia bacterium]|nr:alpha/beta fold hydrolase [Blastocatellia bacterium]
MDNVIILLHGSANGSYSWRQVKSALRSQGLDVFAPDMLGYGKAPAPSGAYSIQEEVAHLQGELDLRGVGSMHLVAHSLGSMIGLHLRRVLGARVTRMTLIEPVVVSVLRQQAEEVGYAEMEAQYQRFMHSLPDETKAARTFVEHWSGKGVWDSIGERARSVITSLVPKVRLEMIAARSDTTRLADFAESPPPTTILVGEKTLAAPFATVRQLAPAFRAATLVVLGAAHMIPLTHATAVVDAVRSEVNV